jgi:hypothetical protein
MEEHMETNASMPEPAESAGESSQAGKTPTLYGAMSWKTVVFVVVIILAGAVAAHSLLNGRANLAGATGDGSSVASGCPHTGAVAGGCPQSKACCPGGKCQEGAAQQQCKKPDPNNPDTTALGCCPASAVPKQ